MTYNFVFSVCMASSEFSTDHFSNQIVIIHPMLLNVSFIKSMMLRVGFLAKEI